MKEKMIDLVIIQSIRKLQKPGRPDLLKDLIALFLVTTEEHIRNLRAAVENKDLATVARIAHSAKSSAANLGALVLSEAAYDLEKIGNGDANPERLKEIFQRVEMAYIETIDALKEL